MHAQSWTIEVTPAQRWILFQLAHSADQRVNGQEARRYRQFLRAFGLHAIRDTARTKNGVKTSRTVCDEPRLHNVTLANLDYLLRLADVERSPAQEDALGDLFDLAVSLKSGREYETPDGTGYTSDADEWDPPSDAKKEAFEELTAALDGLAPAELRLVTAFADALATDDAPVASDAAAPVPTEVGAG